MLVVLIRQTGQKLNVRLWVHHTAFHLDKFHESMVAAHYNHTGHDIQQISAKLPRNCSEGRLLKIDLKRLK